MNFNICIIQPSGYIHSAAFTELAELICYGLQDLGHKACINTNRFLPNEKNIIIGVHLTDISQIKNIDKSSIIVNTEQITGIGEKWRNGIFEWVSNFETWDYSEQNIKVFRASNLPNVKLIRIGYHEKLNRIKNSAHQDIDVLFYGSMNDRRKQVIDKLISDGYNVVTAFGLYGKERDDLISRAKIVLNHHYYDSKIFEIVRVFYLMSNAKAVVGEVSEETHIDERYLTGFYSCSYDNLVESCKKLIDDKALRENVEENALKCIRSLPQHMYMEELLD
jgi:hypothetical protein